MGGGGGHGLKHFAQLRQKFPLLLEGPPQAEFPILVILFSKTVKKKQTKKEFYFWGFIYFIFWKKKREEIHRIRPKYYLGCDL